MRQLTHLRNGEKVAEYLLDMPDIVIGRGRAAHIRLEENPLISRQHAVIRTVEKGHLVEDLGGANGTFIDGRAITSAHLLRPGERITLGNDALRYDFGHRGAISLRVSAGLGEALSDTEDTDGDADPIEEISVEDLQMVTGVDSLSDLGESNRARGRGISEESGSERTTVASKDELNRLLDRMAIKAKPHVQVLEPTDDPQDADAGVLVALKAPPVLVGHTEACALRLPGSRWLRPGKVAGQLLVEAGRWQIAPASPFWNPISVGGETLRRIRMLENGEVFAAGGRRFVFRRGEGR